MEYLILIDSLNQDSLIKYLNSRPFPKFYLVLIKTDHFMDKKLIFVFFDLPLLVKLKKKH